MDRPAPGDKGRSMAHDMEQWHELRSDIDAEIADGDTAWRIRLPELLDLLDSHPGSIHGLMRAHHHHGLDGVAEWLDREVAWPCKCGRPVEGRLDGMLRGGGVLCPEGRGCNRQLMLAGVG